MQRKQILIPGTGVAVTDPTQSTPVANGTDLNTALANIAAEAGSGALPSDAPAAGVTVGGISSGTPVADKTYAQLFDMLLHPEYAPQWADATASIAAKIGNLVETGTVVPTVDEENFTIGGTAAKATGGTNVANGGAATNTITCSTTAGSAKTTFGSVTYTLSRAYAAGNTAVETAQGNPTNKTANNATTLLSAASVNSNINATTKYIKAITKTATYTVNFVDAFYANTAAIGTMGKLALTTASELVLDFPVATGDNRHAFSIPSSYTNVVIYIWNSVANGGEWQLYTGTFAQSSETKTLADGKTTKSYTKYTRDVNGPATKFKVTFTKA